MWESWWRPGESPAVTLGVSRGYEETQGSGIDGSRGVTGGVEGTDGFARSRLNPVCPVDQGFEGVGKTISESIPYVGGTTRTSRGEYERNR